MTTDDRQGVSNHRQLDSLFEFAPGTSKNNNKIGAWFNIKMSSYQYRKSHCGDKAVVRSSYLHNGISYTGKMTFFILNQDQDRHINGVFLGESTRDWLIPLHKTSKEESVSMSWRHHNIIVVGVQTRITRARPRPNIKTICSDLICSDHKDETDFGAACLYNGNFGTYKTASLYWDGPQFFLETCDVSEKARRAVLPGDLSLINQVFALLKGLFVDTKIFTITFLSVYQVLSKVLNKVKS